MLHDAMMAADDLAFLATLGGEPQEPAPPPAVKVAPAPPPAVTLKSRPKPGRRFEKPSANLQNVVVSPSVVDNWPEPILPGHAPVPEIPVDVLPSWVRDMASAVAESTQTPPTMAVMISLSVLATVLHRRFEVAPFGEMRRWSAGKSWSASGCGRRSRATWRPGRWQRSESRS